MDSFSDSLLGMELDKVESLLRAEGVNFVIEYTEADRKKNIPENLEEKNRIVRVREIDEGLELTVCII